MQKTLHADTFFEAYQDMGTFRDITCIDGKHRHKCNGDGTPLAIHLHGSYRTDNRHVQGISMVSAYTAFAMRVFGMEQLFGSILRQYNVIRGIGVVGQLSGCPPLTGTETIRIEKVRMRQKLYHHNR